MQLECLKMKVKGEKKCPHFLTAHLCLYVIYHMTRKYQTNHINRKDVGTKLCTTPKLFLISWDTSFLRVLLLKHFHSEVSNSTIKTFVFCYKNSSNLFNDTCHWNGCHKEYSGGCARLEVSCGPKTT